MLWLVSSRSISVGRQRDAGFERNMWDNGKMQSEKTLSVTSKLMRWFVPIAALLVLAGFLFVTPPGLLGKADGIGYAICHRIDERSFQLFGRQLPLCARCTGEYNAAAISLIFFGFVMRLGKFYIRQALVILNQDRLTAIKS